MGHRAVPHLLSNFQLQSKEWVLMAMAVNSILVGEEDFHSLFTFLISSHLL